VVVDPGEPEVRVREVAKLPDGVIDRQFASGAGFE